MEKAPKSTIPDIDKRKFLVPNDLTGWIVNDLLAISMLLLCPGSQEIFITY